MLPWSAVEQMGLSDSEGCGPKRSACFWVGGSKPVQTRVGNWRCPAGWLLLLCGIILSRATISGEQCLSYVNCQRWQSDFRGMKGNVRYYHSNVVSGRFDSRRMRRGGRSSISHVHKSTPAIDVCCVTMCKPHAKQQSMHAWMHGMLACM